MNRYLLLATLAGGCLFGSTSYYYLPDQPPTFHVSDVRFNHTADAQNTELSARIENVSPYALIEVSVGMGQTLGFGNVWHDTLPENTFFTGLNAWPGILPGGVYDGPILRCDPCQNFSWVYDIWIGLTSYETGHVEMAQLVDRSHEYLVWQRPPVDPAAYVPEPSTLALALSGLPLCLGFARCRRGGRATDRP